MRKPLRGVEPGQRCLVGVSGGRDSVALLHWLLQQGFRRLVVCHLDHQLRGPEAQADARFVARLAGKLGMDAEFDSLNVTAFAEASKQSLESAGREARYAFFARAARKRRCRTVFLGHHADDQVETFLINLFRGAGPLGLSGMSEISERQVGRGKLVLIRPLLGVWREEIDAYIAQHRLRFREDATNRSLAPLRNRVRHEIIPLLEKQFGRSIRRTVWRAANIAAGEETWLATLIPSSAIPQATLSTGELLTAPVALQRRLIIAWLQHRGVPEINFDLVESIRALADAENGVAKINLPGSRHARRRAGTIFIEPACPPRPR